MENLEKYNNAFKEVLNISDDGLAGLTYRSVVEWDSVGHMALMTELERIFDVVMDAMDIIDFNSYETGKTILAKYGVRI